jgi:hypothetical protein
MTPIELSLGSALMARQRLVAVHLRHHHVTDDDPGGSTPRHFERFVAVARHDNGKAVLL